MGGTLSFIQHNNKPYQAETVIIRKFNYLPSRQDGTLISFDRAAKELGMTLVPIKIDDDLQDENSKLRALISNNFGRRKNDPAKDRKVLATYVELQMFITR